MEAFISPIGIANVSNASEDGSIEKLEKTLFVYERKLISIDGESV